MTEKYFNIRYEFDRGEVLRAVENRLADPGAGGTFIAVADGNILQMVHRDKEYRAVIDSSMFAICDSSWVPFYIKRIYGVKKEQYCGSDIFRDFISLGKFRMMFMGGQSVVLAGLKSNLEKTYPGMGNPRFVELPYRRVEDFDYESIAAEINEFSPDIIWVALGAPKQERFAYRISPLLKRGVVIPVGAVFNFFSGVGVARAPKWMIRCHIEFLARIFSEPVKQLTRCRDILRTVPSIFKEEKERKKGKEKDNECI